MEPKLISENFHAIAELQSAAAHLGRWDRAPNWGSYCLICSLGICVNDERYVSPMGNGANLASGSSLTVSVVVNKRRSETKERNLNTSILQSVTIMEKQSPPPDFWRWVGSSFPSTYLPSVPVSLSVLAFRSSSRVSISLPVQCLFSGRAVRCYPPSATMT